MAKPSNIAYQNLHKRIGKSVLALLLKLAKRQLKQYVKCKKGRFYSLSDWGKTCKTFCLEAKGINYIIYVHLHWISRFEVLTSINYNDKGQIV
jgi:hypothetical protein